MPELHALSTTDGLSRSPEVDTPETDSDRSNSDSTERRPVARYRCGGCALWWTALGAAHCAGCHETFTSVSGFEKHRRGGQCLTPAEVGLVPADRKWPGWALPGSYDPTAEEAP